MSSTIEARLARLEAAVGLTVPVRKKRKVSNNDDEKLEEISDLVAKLEQKVKSNQESIDDKLGEIVSCLAELKSETKSEASTAKEIQTAQPVEAKAANKQRIIESAILANRQDIDLQFRKYGVMKIGDFSLRKFYDLEVILQWFQSGQTAVVPQARSYSCNAPQNDEEVISYFVNAIHGLTGTKPITEQYGLYCKISYPD
eukprot:scaffold2909_cov78-Cylindrotheca_fusiformis.AAC.9